MQNNTKFNAAERRMKPVSGILMSHLIEQLEQFAKEDPDDPFNHYALALEYLKTDVARARQIFEQLIEQHRQYVPGYYQLGQLYAEQGETEKALAIFERGIVAARELGDLKAMKEMDGARLAVLYDS